MCQFVKKLSKTVFCVIIATGVIFCSGVTVKADTVADTAAFYEQYQAALMVQASMQQTQANAVNQAYLLNAVQAMQNAQYQAMIQKQGLEYQDYLMKEFNESQKQAMQAFLGYNGL